MPLMTTSPDLPTPDAEPDDDHEHNTETEDGRQRGRTD